MQYEFFSVPAEAGGPEALELNHFLQANQVRTARKGAKIAKYFRKQVAETRLASAAFASLREKRRSTQAWHDKMKDT